MCVGFLWRKTNVTNGGQFCSAVTAAQLMDAAVLPNCLTTVTLSLNDGAREENQTHRERTNQTERVQSADQ